MKKISDKKIILTILIITGIATVSICLAMNVFIIPKIEAGGDRIFDMRTLGYSVDEAKAFVKSLDQERTNIYLNVQLPLDFVFPVFYTIFFSLLWIALTKNKKLLFLTPLLAVFDYLENSFSIVMLKNHDFSPTIAKLGSVSTIIKNVLMYVIILALLVAIIVKVVKTVKAKKTNENANNSD